MIVASDGNICTTNNGLLQTAIFKEVLYKYLDSLREKDSPLLSIIPASFAEDEAVQNQKIVELLQLLGEHTRQDIIKSHPEFNEFFIDTYMFNQFIEELYNFWRNYERFFILLSTEKKDQHYHKKPYRSFNNTIEQLNHLVRSCYRDICENITSEHPRVYRQMPAGFQVGIIASAQKQNMPETYSFLKQAPIIRQILIEPPLIINPLMNKRTGLFRRVDSNPIKNLDFDPADWLCYPAKVGDLVIHIFFHMKFIGLGSAVANLFDLAEDEDLTRTPDAIYLFGVDEKVIVQHGEPQTIFYDDTENNLLVGFVSRKDEYGYFGYLKKMVLTLHNIICVKKGRLPLHGAMVRICLKNGISKNIILVGDSGAGKSELLEALRILSQEYLREMVIIFDDMGSLEIKDGKLKAYGTETGAFVRLDDLQPGFVYGNLDRSIIMSPEKINARAVLPITTLKEIIQGHNVDLILYANNYSTVQQGDCINQFTSWQDAFDVFKEGKRMAKGTTSESGITQSYFANPFGPPQYENLHEEIATRFFNFFFEKDMIVGEIKTMLGIPGYETKGPESAAKALFDFISKN